VRIAAVALLTLAMPLLADEASDFAADNPWFAVLHPLALDASPAASGAMLTISHQPIETWRASWGAKLPGVAEYSVQICNQTASTFTIAGGRIRQLVETAAHINVVDAALVPATGQRAQRHSKLNRGLTILKWSGAAASFAIALRQPAISPTWTSVATGVSGGAALAQSTLSTDAAQAQQQAAAATAAVLDTNVLYPIGPAPACMPSRIVFGDFVPGFKPVSIPLP